jgi:thiamine-phosphate pyrophosphorylase
MTVKNIDKLKNIDLYAVVSSFQSSYDDPVFILDEILKTPIKIVQLREKHLEKVEKHHLAEIFRKKTAEKGVLLIINDDVDIALSVNADGVHLGNADMPLAEARKTAPGLIIGKSSHSVEEALVAEKMGASYVNVGPIFKTPTKQNAIPVGMELFKEVKKNVKIPVTVMGGICLENLSEVCINGADKIAMVRGVIYENIEDRVSSLYDVYYKYFKTVS